MVVLGIVVSLTTASPAKADLTLTVAGINDGFTLSTYATLDPGRGGCCGPLGVGVLPNGNIIVNNISPDTRWVFPDVDGQTPATSLFSTPSGGFNNPAFATTPSGVYGANTGGGVYVQFNDDGTINHFLTGVTPHARLGSWGNPVNGHIITDSSAGLIDIDPLANGGLGSFRVINSGAFGDGVTVSPDGTTAYEATGSQICGHNIATGVLVACYGGFPSPDGSGVITSTNSLNGQIIVNNNNGEVDLLDPVAGTFVAIATGGTRGDYVSPDTSNGTLFMDFSDVIERLSCGPNCSIGGPPQPPSVPEPSTMALLGISLAGLGLIRRFKAN